MKYVHYFLLNSLLAKFVSGNFSDTWPYFLRLDSQQYINGEPLTQKAYDSKVILIIGDWKELENSSNTLEKEIKKKTLELFRRDSRNVEILTFDELFERAKFIVEGAKQLSVVSELI